MSHLLNFCRFCALSKSASELRDLTTYTENLEDIKRILKLLDIHFVKFSDDALPKSICANCYHNLKNCCRVFDRIREAQGVLTDLFSNEGNIEKDSRQSVIVQKRDDDTSDDDLPSLEIDESVRETDRASPPAEEPINSKPRTWSTYQIKCHQCSKLTTSLPDLKEHCMSVHGVFHGYQCTDCGINVPTFHTFVEHARDHRPELIDVCPICDIITQDSNHINSHPESFSDQTLFVAPSAEDKEKKKEVRNVVQIKNWNEYSWVCQLCNLEFQQQVALRTHLKELHRLCFGFKCMDCDTVTKRFDLFVSHVTKHRPNLEIVCEYCNFEMKERLEYIVHINGHTRDHKCKVCGEFFHDRSVYRAHKSMYNSSMLEDSARSVGQDSVPEEPLRCDVCGVVCARPHSLRQHKLIHTRTTKDHVCNRCGKSYFQKSHLHAHFAKAHQTNTFKCEMCKESFKRLKDLKAHKEVHEKPHKCNQCSRRFRLRSHLCSHMKLHSTATPYTCKICKLNFKYKNALKKHERAHNQPLLDISLADRSDYITQINANLVQYLGTTSRQYDPEVLKDWAEIMSATKKD